MKQKNSKKGKKLSLNLLLIGPQGSGKGTQVERLIADYNLPYFSTGNIIRENIQKGTQLGIKAQAVVESGNLVSDNLVNALFQDWLENTDVGEGYILDGYPRTMDQAHYLAKASEVSLVLHIDIPDDVARKRILGRVGCSKCGIIYNTIFVGQGPKTPGICDKCSSPVTKRKDDIDPKSVDERLEKYHLETAPVLSLFKDKIVRIDGTKSIDEVYYAIQQSLAKYLKG